MNAWTLCQRSWNHLITDFTCFEQLLFLLQTHKQSRAEQCEKTQFNTWFGTRNAGNMKNLTWIWNSPKARIYKAEITQNLINKSACKPKRFRMTNVELRCKLNKKKNGHSNAHKKWHENWLVATAKMLCDCFFFCIIDCIL